MKFLVYVSGKPIGGMMKKNVNFFSVLLLVLSFISGCKESNSMADIESVFASDDAFQKAVEQQKADDLIGARESFKKIVVAVELGMPGVECFNNLDCTNYTDFMFYTFTTKQN